MCLFSLNSEPCPPTNIQANASCGQPTATVSWQQSDLAAGYVAYFDSQRGHDTFCVGTDRDTSCVVSGLMCGTVYSIWVKALGHQYNSSDSIVVPLTSGNENPTQRGIKLLSTDQFNISYSFCVATSSEASY